MLWNSSCLQPFAQICLSLTDLLYIGIVVAAGVNTCFLQVLLHLAQGNQALGEPGKKPVDKGYYDRTCEQETF